jgi:predicted kinase
MGIIRLQCAPKTLIVPVAVPGSGKSTLLGQVLPHSGFRHGPDDVRRALYGSVEEQGHGGKVHDAARACLECRLAVGLPAAYDATNLTKRERLNLLVMADQNDYYTVALIGQVSKEVAKERNAQRTSPVPEFVIDRMVKKLEVPTTAEGFDRLVYFDQSTGVLEVEWTD